MSQLRKLAYSIVNSPTKVMPLWKSAVKSVGLEVKLMPRDVATRWNSTFTMLDFAIEYQDAVEKLAADKELRKYELDAEEWEMAKQLRDVLHVSIWRLTLIVISDACLAGVLRCHHLFLILIPQPCSSDPRHGLHRRDTQ